MRQLTIRRESARTNKRKTDQVYIADPQYGTVPIDNMMCSKLGELRNGEQQTFPIGEGPVRIFVNGGKKPAAKKGDSVWIPAGTEDLFLSGIHSFTLSTNGWFRFVTDTSPETMKKRKRSMVLTWAVLLAVAAVSFFLGKFVAQKLFSPGYDYDTPQVFTSNGLTLTLTREFKVEDSIAYTSGFTSKDAAVFALKEPFSQAPGVEDLTLEEYVDLMREANGKLDCEQKNYNGIPGFEYDFTNEEEGKEYHFRIFAYKAEDAFWNVQFVTLKKQFPEFEEKINTWAASARFDKAQ